MRRWPWLAAVVAVHAADALTTRLALDRGAREGNPVAAALFEQVGFWPTVAAGFVICLAATPLCWWRSAHLPVASTAGRWGARAVLVAGHAVVVASNVRVLAAMH